VKSGREYVRATTRTGSCIAGARLRRLDHGRRSSRSLGKGYDRNDQIGQYGRRRPYDSYSWEVGRADGCTSLPPGRPSATVQTEVQPEAGQPPSKHDHLKLRRLPSTRFATGSTSRTPKDKWPPTARAIVGARSERRLDPRDGLVPDVKSRRSSTGRVTGTKGPRRIGLTRKTRPRRTTRP